MTRIIMIENGEVERVCPGNTGLYTLSPYPYLCALLALVRVVAVGMSTFVCAAIAS